MIKNYLKCLPVFPLFLYVSTQVSTQADDDTLRDLSFMSSSGEIQEQWLPASDNGIRSVNPGPGMALSRVQGIYSTVEGRNIRKNVRCFLLIL